MTFIKNKGELSDSDVSEEQKMTNDQTEVEMESDQEP
jgi:hypothetical protein